MKVLVTGAAGFLGRAVVDHLLAAGSQVRALVRQAPPAADARVETVAGDICHRASLAAVMNGCDAVVHAAARVSTRGPWSEFEAANVLGARNVAETAIDAGVRRIVHISSLGVYAVPRDNAEIYEDSAYEAGGSQRGFYARSKLVADRWMRQAAKVGAPIVVLRPGLLYGPGRRPPLARQSVALGPLRVILGRPGYLLPLSYVGNVADAVCRAVEARGIDGRAYNIVDTHVSQSEYAARYRRAAGEDWQAVYLPAPLIMPLAIAADLAGKAAGRSLPISRHQIQRTTWSARYDCRRAECDLGWRPEVGVEEGLRRTFAVGAT